MAPVASNATPLPILPMRLGAAGSPCFRLLIASFCIPESVNFSTVTCSVAERAFAVDQLPT